MPPASSTIVAPLTEREKELRAQRLSEWKLRIASSYSTYLLQLPASRAPEVVYVKDTKEERERKLRYNEQIIEELDQMYRERRDELVKELERLTEKVKETIRETGDVDKHFGFSGSMQIEEKLFCMQCGNENSDFFAFNEVEGTKICLGRDGKHSCGEVVRTNNIHLGAGIRNFEDKEDRTHFGPKPNRLMPDHVNLEVSLLAINPADKRILRAQQNVDLNLSKLENKERHTRAGYKTSKKREAFSFLEDVGQKLGVPGIYIQRAKEIFAIHRDVKDTVHNFEGTVLGCIVAAFEENPTEIAFEVKHTFKKSEITHETSTEIPSRSKSTDVAICSIPDKAIGKFTLADVETWLKAVASQKDKLVQDEDEPVLDPSAYVERILTFIRHQFEADEHHHANVPENPKKQAIDLNSSMFKATVASRNAAPIPSTNNQKSHSNTGERFAGKYLLNSSVFERALKEMSIAEASETAGGCPMEEEDNEENEDVKYEHRAITRFFSQAVHRRNNFDKILTERLEEYEKEQRRLRIASNTSLQQRERELASVAKPVTKKQEVEEEQLVIDDDFDFDNLMGGASVKKISKKIVDPGAKGTVAGKPTTTSGAANATTTGAAAPGGTKKRKLNLVFASSD